MASSTLASPWVGGISLAAKPSGGDHPDTSIDLAHGRLTVSDNLVYWQGERINLTRMQAKVLRLVMETYPRPALVERVALALYDDDNRLALRAHFLYIRRRMGPILLTVGAVPLGHVGINPMFEYRPRVSASAWYLSAKTDLKSDDLWDDFLS